MLIRRQPPVRYGEGFQEVFNDVFAVASAGGVWKGTDHLLRREHLLRQGRERPRPDRRGGRHWLARTTSGARFPSRSRRWARPRSRVWLADLDEFLTEKLARYKHLTELEGPDDGTDGSGRCTSV